MFQLFKRTVLLAFAIACSLCVYPVSAIDSVGRIEISSAQDSMISKILPGFVLHVENARKLVTLQKADGSAMVLMQILKPEPKATTLQKYAEHVMNFYQGTKLTAQPQRRGYSFHYQDSCPCVGLVSFFDGSSYLLMSACGKLSLDEATKAFTVAKKQLGVEEILQRTALPNVYY